MRYLLVTLFIVSLFLTAPGCWGVNIGEQKQVAKDENKEKPKEKQKEKRPNLMKRKTSEVIDYQKAMKENPKLKEVKNVVAGGDPITQSLSSYIALSSQVNVMAFQHNIDLNKAIDDRNPTYDEIVKEIKTFKIEFNALPDNQKYAYDEKRAIFTILEDPDIENSFHGEEVDKK